MRHGWLAAAGLLLFGMVPLTGCSNFFSCEGKAACPASSSSGTSSGSGSSPTNTGDFAFVANSLAGTTFLSEYSIASNTLNGVGTQSLGFVPVALAVAPSNAFLYVASAPGSTTPGVYVYSIGATGQLTAVAQPALADEVSAMAVSPDGNWLFTVNISGITLNEYKVNTATGTLSFASALTLPGSACNLTTALPVSQTCSVAVSPNSDYVVAALGVAGDAVLSYTSAGGITGSTYPTIASGYPGIASGDFSVTLNSNDDLFIARTASLSVDSIEASGIFNTGTLPYPTGYSPRSITLSKSQSYLYTANEDNNSISGFGVGTNGALTALTGSNYPASMGVSALGVDNSGNYLLAVGYDANTGIRLYSIGSAGALTQVAQTGSGANEDYPALVAMTH